MQCHPFEISKGRRGELHSCLHLVDIPYIDISSPCMFLEMNVGELKCAKCISLIIVGWSVEKMNSSCLRVGVVPN